VRLAADELEFDVWDNEDMLESWRCSSGVGFSVESKNKDLI
jgi:hypothetical protein